MHACSPLSCVCTLLTHCALPHAVASPLLQVPGLPNFLDDVFSLNFQQQVVCDRCCNNPKQTTHTASPYMYSSERHTLLSCSAMEVCAAALQAGEGWSDLVAVMEQQKPAACRECKEQMVRRCGCVLSSKTTNR